MRHDPAVAAVVIMLRELKMHGMAQAVTELAEQGAPAFAAAQPILSQLLKAETAEREVRSVAYQLKIAKFPAYKDLAGFSFAHSEVNEALVRQLHRCEFLEEANNVVLVGGPGTGKTHIATALGVQAIEHHHRRVRFFSTVELVNALEEEKANGKPGQLAHRLAYADLVILDELGYLPFSASGGALLFHLLSKLYERTSVVITRECLAIDVAGAMRSKRVIEVLSRLVSLHGAPLFVRSDNGPEFVSQAILEWISGSGIATVLNDPGKPWQNGTDESFNGKFRDECLSLEWFRSRREAAVLIEAWRNHYNEVRPHSSLQYLTPAEFKQELRQNLQLAVFQE